MKKIRSGLLFGIIVCSLVPAARVHASSVTDSTMSIGQVRSVVSFLEDSQKVSEFINQLKLLDSLRQATIKSDTAETENEIAAKSTRVTTVMEGVISTLHQFTAGVMYEISKIRKEISFLKSSDFIKTALQKTMHLIIAGAIALLAGFLLMLFLRKAGNALRKLYAEHGEKHRLAGIGSMIMTGCACGLGGIVTLQVVQAGNADVSVQLFMSCLIQALLSYTAVRVITEVVLSTDYDKLRMLSCSDAAARDVKKRVLAVARFILIVAAVHYLSEMTGLINVGRLITVLFLLVLTILLPYTLHKMKVLFSRSFGDPDMKNGTPATLSGVLDSLQSPLNIISAIFIIIIAGISIAGTRQAYTHVLDASIKSLLIFFIGGFHLLLWKKCMVVLKGVEQKFSMDHTEAALIIRKNTVIIKIFGYAVISMVIIILTGRTWGLHLGQFVQSDIPVIRHIVRILIVFSGAWCSIQVAYFIISRFQITAKTHMLEAQHANTIEIEKRITTLGGIFQKIITSTVIVIGVIMVLDELGFDVKAMVAGIGIVGVAVGFGAQNLVRDIISGLFIIFENRIRVGDVAIINGTGGNVEQVNLRTIVLRSEDGTVHVFPNGAISTLSNMTHEYSYYVFKIGVAYKEDTDTVTSVLQALGEELRGDPRFKEAILEPLEIMGVDAFADSAVMIKARIKTLPLQQWFVGREMNRRIKKRFDELGIEIPYSHRTINFDSSSSLPVKISYNASLDGKIQKATDSLAE